MRRALLPSMHTIRTHIAHTNRQRTLFALLCNREIHRINWKLKISSFVRSFLFVCVKNMMHFSYKHVSESMINYERENCADFPEHNVCELLGYDNRSVISSTSQQFFYSACPCVLTLFCPFSPIFKIAPHSVRILSNNVQCANEIQFDVCSIRECSLACMVWYAPSIYDDAWSLIIIITILVSHISSSQITNAEV